MAWDFPHYVFPLFLMAAVGISIAVYALRRRQVPGALPFAVLFLAVSLWSLAYAFELSSASLAGQTFWLKFKQFGVLAVPGAWLWFSLQYTGHSLGTNRRVLLGIAIEWVVLLSLAWTNDRHGLVWQEIAQVNNGPYPMLDVSGGAAFWLHVSYTYFLVIVGAFLFLRVVVNRPTAYRTRTILVLISLSAPIWASLLALARSGSSLTLDLTPYAFLITSGIVFWGIIRFQFLEILPMAQRAIIEEMSDGLVLLDLQNKIVYLNRSACAILGRSSSDLVGKPIEQVLPDWAEIKDFRAERANEGGQGFISNEISLEIDSVPRYYELSLSPLEGPNAVVTGWLLVWHDITPSRMAADALREQNLHLQMVTNQTPAVLWSTDVQLRFTSIVGAGLNALNLQPNQVVGMTIQEFLGTDDATNPILVAHQRALQGQASLYEADVNGHTFQSYLEPLLNEAGEMIGTVGIGLDVTSQIQAEKSSRLSQQRFMQLVDNSPTPIFSVDPKGLVRAWNPACENIFQYGHEIINQHYSMLLRDSRSQVLIDELLAQVIEHKRSFNNLDIDYCARDSSHRHMNSRLYPLLNQLGNVEACVFANTDITERVHAEMALREQLEELSVLHAIATACVEASDEDALIERATQIIGDVFYPDNFGLILLDAKTGLLKKHFSYRERVNDSNTPYPLGLGITGRVALEGRPWRVADVAQEPTYVRVDPLTRSELCIPLKIGERVIGVINTESDQVDDFSPDDERLLTIIAGQLATAIERLRAEKAEKQRLHELLAIARVSREITLVMDRQQVLDTIARLAVEISNADASGLFTFQPDGLLHLVAAHGVGEEFVRELGASGLSLPGTAIGRAITTRRPYQIPDVSKEPTYSVPRLVELENIRSILALPMLRGEEVIGGILIWHRQPRLFTEEEEMFFQALANQTVNAVENARLFEIEREQRRLAEVLRETGTELSRQLTLDEVVRGVGQAALNLDKADRAVLFLNRPDGPLYCAWRHNLSLNYVNQVVTHLRHLPGWQLLQTLEPVLISDTLALPEDNLVRRLSQEEAFRSLCLWPLVYEGSALAIIGLYHDVPHTWSETDQGILLALSRQASIALQNARLFDETRRRALQQETLNEIIAAVVAAPDLSHLLDTVFDLTLRAVAVEKGGIWVSGKSVLRGFPPEIDAQSSQLALIHSAVIPAKLIVDDWQKVEPDDPRAIWVEHMAKFGIRASLYSPVLASGERIGALSLASETPRDWLPEEVDLVEAVGRQLGSAVERLDLLAKTQEQARQMQHIMDTVPEGVLLLDANYMVVLANPAAQEYLSILSEDLSPDQPVHRLAGYPIEHLLQTASKESRRDLRAAGVQGRLFEVAARPLEVQDYQAGWVLVLQDVTQARQDQARIQMQERLATVGQLAAGIAHDFNNIMAAVVVYADLLSMEPNLESSSREQLVIIQQQVQRAVSLIRQILDFSRRAVMEQSALDLLPFLKELAKLLERVLPENIRLELTYQPGNYMAKVDPSRLQQALMNLVLNARDAMPEGGSLQFILDRFELAPGEPSPSPYISPGDWIRLVVRDTGTGIAPEVMPHIFDPFFTTKPVGRGTGLGLAQVYGIIKQHGGSIDVHSKVGEGAQFEIYLPALETELDESLVVQTIPIKRGSGEAVLLVEDDPAAREALKSLLETHNYRVFSAESGVEALQIFEQVADKIALVVSDVVMPEMGGVALYRALQERQPQIKFLFITGHPMDFENQMPLETGKVEWLQKPFTVREFSAALKAMLSQSP